MYDRIRAGLLAVIGLSLISTASLAGGLNSYSQNFEGLNIAGTEIGDGWLYYVNVFDGGGGFKFGYGGVAAPNGPQISAIAAGEGDTNQGAQQLSVYSDYNCCDLGTGTPQGHGNGTDLVETNVYQEQTIGSANNGETWSFNFDAKLGNLTGGSTAVAFIKVLDPSDNFSQTAIVTLDMTAIPGTWNSYQLDLAIGAWNGQLLQFGYQTNASNFVSSGVFYDNVTFGGGADAGIEPYSDDFESYNAADEFALGNAGWLVFGNVSDAFGGFLYGYGPNPAPNNGLGFSGVAVGEGGAEQGAQQLNTFSDYQNADAHFEPGCDQFSPNVESIVYREQPIAAANVGETWTFTFEAKRGNLMPPTTARAFIKTIDPNDGFATTNNVFQLMTTTPTTWTPYQLSLEIDAGLVGQLIQIGFSNRAQCFNPSGVFYDNVVFSSGTDTDGDGVDDSVDNCTVVANADQRDTDGDNIGNICDPDVDGLQTCLVNFTDLNVFRTNFFMSGDLDTDLDGSGSTNFVDLNIVRDFFFQQPGPSAAGCN